MAIDAYEFDYDGKHYRWDRSTLRSPEGRAEIQRVLRERVTELGYLGYTVGYQGLKDIETAKNVLEALNGNITEPLLRAIETDMIEKLNVNVTQENEMAETTSTTAKSPEVDVDRIREMNAIAATPEGREARQRAATGQSLTPAQAALVKRYYELETKNNEVARHEQHSPGGWMKTTRPHSIPAELHAIERIADVRERTHAIRQQKAAWRDDPKSPFNDASHPEHKNYVEAMSRLYQAEEELGRQPEDPE